MLNKIKVIGKLLPIKIKEQNETTNDFDKSEKRKSSLFYFSLSVINPSNSLTILRCVAYGELAERIEKQNREMGQDEVVVVEVKGYLRNERQNVPSNKDAPESDKSLPKLSNEEFQKNEVKENRQILIRVSEFNRLDLDFNDIDTKNSNQVRLLGKIITDVQAPQDNPEVLSFKIVVSREGNNFPLFFCRAEGELMTEIRNKLKKGDIILLEGFLQTKILQKKTEGGTDEKNGVNPPRVSSIICRGFTFLDNDSANIFGSLDNLTRIVKKVKEIDFTKPKFKRPTDTKN